MYKICKDCGNFFEIDKENPRQKYCQDCQYKHKYDIKGTKIVTCADCGKEFEVDARNMKKIRCDNCQKKYRKKWDRERKQSKIF